MSLHPIINPIELNGAQVLEMMEGRLVDYEEKVRGAAVAAICTAASSTPEVSLPLNDTSGVLQATCIISVGGCPDDECDLLSWSDLPKLEEVSKVW